MIDIHIHTSFSPDSNCPMENYIKKAIEMGVKTIGFSEHINLDMKFHGLEYGGQTDLELVEKEIFALRKRYGDKINILFGAEIGYDENIVDEFNDLVKRYNFDYVINSIHLVYGEDAWLMPYYANKTKEEAYGLYLDDVYESLFATYKFNTVGHIGYVCRRGPYEDYSMKVEDYRDKFEKIFKRMIDLDVALEINTKAGRGFEFLPTREMLELYLSLGGTKFTFGSDAHFSDRILDGMEVVSEFLLTHGITHTIHFEKGEEILDRIDV